MSLQTPILDDRRFQDIVNEAKKRIPQYCEEWTDHNVSDPGVTLIELFAWMTDMMLYRMNQVPRKHYIKFLDMLGITLDGPVSARVPVSFWLSAPQETAVLIPAGTEVASTQTATERAIVFTTEDDFQVQIPQLEAVISEVATQRAYEKRFVNHNQRRLSAGFDVVEVFSPVPQINDALYLGFSNDLSNHILGLDMVWDTASGAGVDPTLPPYLWEVATGRQEDRWQPCEVEMDSTRGFNSGGQVQLHLPQMYRYRINGQSLYWVRVRIREITQPERREGMRPYQTTPRLQQVGVSTWGGTTWASHAQTITHELLGRSTGIPGQEVRLQMAPVLAREAGEHLLVEVDNVLQVWREVPDFTHSNDHDHHYTLDSLTGQIRFGPAVRQRDGAIRMYGAVPPRKATLTYQRYRTGGGLMGNVDTNVLNTLKTAIPYIARVTNRQAAQGGLDAETLETAMMRAPLALQSRDRAVTARDFEFLTQRALPSQVARVRCLQARPVEAGQAVPPGLVYVLVIPHVRYAAGYLTPTELQLAQSDLDTVTAYLDDRRLLTTSLSVRTPAYRWVSVRVRLGALPEADEGAVERGVMARLYRFLNPLTGGADGKGWPFGRDLFLSDIYQALQGTDGVAFIRNVELYAAAPGGERIGQPVDNLDVVAHGVVASGVHEVVFV